MSAREKLEDLMIGTYGMPDEKVLGMLDAYAHELAEKIRSFTITPSGHPSYDDGKDAGLDLGADLIDPEVSSGG